MHRHIIRVALAVNLFVAVAAQAQEPALKLAQTIPLDGVQGRIDHMAIDPEGKRLYVAALGNDTVEVIDLVAGKRIDSIRGLKKPAGVRVLPGSRNIVVASGEDGKVRIFSPDLKLLGTVNDLDDADNVRLDPHDGKLAYVGYGDGAIAIIDAGQCRKIDEVKLDGHPESFQLESNGNRIFVNVPGARHVAVIDRERKSVVATWSLADGQANFPMALDEANHRLFIACRKPAKVIVLDAEQGKTIGSIDCCGDADDLFYDDAAKRLYVTGGEGSISVIECDNNHYRHLTDIPTAVGARTSLFIPEMKLLYVAVPHRGSQRAEIRAYTPEP
jgi:YVTN family beta-propeller protein